MDIDKDFSKHLLSEDELGAVIRAHIHVEASVRDFVDIFLMRPSHLPRLRYEDRLRLAVALGLREDFLPSLKYLGDIRNLFGHNLAAQITEDITTKLHSLLPPEMQKDVIENFMTASTADGSAPREFSSIRPKEQFIIIVATLKGTLVGYVSAIRGLTPEERSLLWP